MTKRVQDGGRWHEIEAKRRADEESMARRKVLEGQQRQKEIHASNRSRMKERKRSEDEQNEEMFKREISLNVRAQQRPMSTEPLDGRHSPAPREIDVFALISVIGIFSIIAYLYISTLWS